MTASWMDRAIAVAERLAAAPTARSIPSSPNRPFCVRRAVIPSEWAIHFSTPVGSKCAVIPRLGGPIPPSLA